MLCQRYGLQTGSGGVQRRPHPAASNLTPIVSGGAGKDNEKAWASSSGATGPSGPSAPSAPSGI